MFQRILVPLDGSPLAEEVLPLAAQLARAASASLILLRVVTTYQNPVPMEPVSLVEQSRKMIVAKSLSYLQRIITNEYLDGIPVQTVALAGLPAQTILQFARTHQVDLVLMRSHGATGFKRWMLGSVAQQLVRHSSIPVLVLRQSDSSAHVEPVHLMHAPRILVPLDGTAQAEAALLPAAQLCAALAAPENGAIHLTYTVHHISVRADEQKAITDKLNEETQAEAEAYLSNVKQRFLTDDLSQFHLSVTTSVVPHSSASEIWKRVLEECKCIGDAPGSTGCDLIAMATHGREGLQHLLEGSITEQVMDATSCPFLVVHVQHAEESTQAEAVTRL
jgi:nucleotide-binding universal stress UspA family protein